LNSNRIGYQDMAKAAGCDDPSVMAAADVARALGADLEAGLTTQEASRRLAAHGPNTLRRSPREPAWRRILSQFQNSLVYLLLGATVIAVAVWAIEGRVGWPVDAIVIIAVVLLNGLLGYLQEARAETAVAALASLTATTSAVMRDGRLARIRSADLVLGDLLALEAGDAVGADARLVQAAALSVREASLTGESEAALKNAATLPRPAPLGDRRDMVFKGTAVAQGGGRAVVTATGMDTEVGSIAEMLTATQRKPTPIETEMGRVGRMLGIAVVIIAVGVTATILLVSRIRGADDVVGILLFGVSLAVAAVPEGLPAILSVTLALGVRRMAGRKAIVKDLSSVESLGCASVIASDKTGTLTRSEMAIEQILTASGGARLPGAEAPPGLLADENAAAAAGPLRAEQIVVLSGGSLAGNAELREGPRGAFEIEGDPTDAAFLVAERKLSAFDRRRRRFRRIAEIPFTPERKLMSTIQIDHDHGDAIVLITKGAPDILLDRCARVRVGMEVVELDAAWRARILADIDSLSDAALRTLAVAYRPLGPGEDVAVCAQTPERDLIYAGVVGMIDPPRDEAAVAVREARRAGIRVIMITGDHPRTAARIAADLGIANSAARALTGAELDRLDAAGFAAAVRETAVFARVAPAHKLRIVGALQAAGEIVAMTGDGVNDAPALKAADIGVAMGVTGTEVTKEAAKMILADDNFATIVEAVREGRGIFGNIRKFLRYLLSSNMGEVLTVFLGVVGAPVIGLTGAQTDSGREIALPLLATQLLWINLLTDAAPALALGVDPLTDDVMARRPRRPDERMIDARMWWDVIEIGAVMAAATLLTIDICLPGGLIEGGHDLASARTAGFTVLVLAQMFNCFNARSETASAFSHLFVNPWLWGAIALSVLLQVAVVNVPVLNVAFGAAPLTLDQWLLCVAMASIVLWFSEARKFVKRRLRRAAAGRAGPN
jgi:magnesium-transporting ATPase (P-type)